jgi:LPXTG-site transpeptidase (sortase) family protein
MTDLGARREAASPGPSIDLRGDPPGADAGWATHAPPGPDPTPEPAPPQTDADGSFTPAPPPAEPEAAESGPSRARTIVLVILATLLGLYCLDVFLLPVAYRNRQQHRADEYRSPKANVKEGDAALLVQIPAIGMDEVVAKGASPVILRGGPGWREGSAPPGQGNTVILGHSTRWGYPFGKIGDLPAGASIYVRTRDGRVYVYRVTKVRKNVANDNTKVMDPTGPSRLTLITSGGGPFDGSRIVVQAGVRGAQPEIPAKLKERVRAVKDPGPFDERGGGGLLLLVAGVVIVAIGVYGFVELRHRYKLMTVFIVAGPAVALGVVLFLFNLDAFLPITY